MTQRVQVTCDFPECREAVAVPDNPIVGGQELSRFGWGSVAVTQAATKRFDFCPEHMVNGDELILIVGQRRRGAAAQPAPLDEEERHL